MELLRERHVKFFQRCLDIIPAEYQSLDTSRLTLLFYALSGLDLLDRLDVVRNRQSIIDWIYSLQLVTKDEVLGNRSGFRGSTTSSLKDCVHALDCSHVTMTYAALASLLVLGDDLTRVNRSAVLAGVRSLRRDNGCFRSTLIGGESDMRFVYCAVAVCHMLNDWSPIDRRKTVDFITHSMSFDSGISQTPMLESHGGCTFCGCAALHLLGELSQAFSQRQRDGLLRWCLFRQISGFNGRPNKEEDTCYTFWVGSTIRMLGGSDLIDRDRLFDFVLGNQDPIIGGFSKSPDSNVDLLHTYLAIAGLSVCGYPGLPALHPALNISQRAADSLKHIHAHWSS